MDWRREGWVCHFEQGDYPHRGEVANLAKMGARIPGDMVVADMLDGKKSAMEPLPGRDPQRHSAEAFCRRGGSKELDTVITLAQGPIHHAVERREGGNGQMKASR